MSGRPPPGTPLREAALAAELGVSRSTLHRLFHATLVAATGSPRLRRFHAQLQQEQRLALAPAERSRRRLGAVAGLQHRHRDRTVLWLDAHGDPREPQATAAPPAWRTTRRVSTWLLVGYGYHSDAPGSATPRPAYDGA
ncbi:FCD domain-containing protein [Amycolatopsis mediterranei]|nr:FCD domain-containing protein [Amycolatopsis mediterranei]